MAFSPGATLRHGVTAGGQEQWGMQRHRVAERPLLLTGIVAATIME